MTNPKEKQFDSNDSEMLENDKSLLIWLTGVSAIPSPGQSVEISTEENAVKR